MNRSTSSDVYILGFYISYSRSIQEIHCTQGRQKSKGQNHREKVKHAKLSSKVIGKNK